MPENVGEKILQDLIERGMIRREVVADPEVRQELVNGYNESFRRVFIREAVAALEVQKVSRATFMKYADAGNLEAAMLILQRDIGDLAAVKLRGAVIEEVTKGR